MRKSAPLLITLGVVTASAFFFNELKTGAISSSPAFASCSDPAAPGVNWEDCRKRNLVMTDFDFSGSNFKRADMSSSDFRKAILDKSDLSKSNLIRASLKGISAVEANFSGALASRTDFSEGTYTGANFEKAEIIRADFSGSIIVDANMSKGDFSRLIFSGATINNVKFDYSNLARSDFRNVNIEGPISLKGAFLFQTRLEGVNLGRATDLQDWQLEMACGDSNTVLPDGVKTPANWPCPEEAG